MINPVYFDIVHPDGSKRAVIIEPVLDKTNGGIAATGSYRIYKNAVDNQSGLFTEKLEIDEKNDELPDKDNPDFLGSIAIQANGKWRYEGDLLTPKEQAQVSGFIQRNQ